MSRFFVEFKEWSTAFNESTSKITDNTSGEVEDIDFRFGPPARNGLPCFIAVNGREQLLFELSDIDPPFTELRRWMERSTRLSSLDRLNPEMVSIDCIGRVVTLSLVPASWADDGDEMWSLLTVTESGSRKPLVKSFCRAYQTVGRFYRALLSATERYEKEFSDPSRWEDPERFNGMEERSCAERIREELRSETIEIRIGKTS